MEDSGGGRDRGVRLLSIAVVAVLVAGGCAAEAEQTRRESGRSASASGQTDAPSDSKSTESAADDSKTTESQSSESQPSESDASESEGGTVGEPVGARVDLDASEGRRDVSNVDVRGIERAMRIVGANFVGCMSEQDTRRRGSVDFTVRISRKGEASAVRLRENTIGASGGGCLLAAVGRAFEGRLSDSHRIAVLVEKQFEYEPAESTGEDEKESDQDTASDDSGGESGSSGRDCDDDRMQLGRGTGADSMPESDDESDGPIPKEEADESEEAEESESEEDPYGPKVVGSTLMVGSGGWDRDAVRSKLVDRNTTLEGCSDPCRSKLVVVLRVGTDGTVDRVLSTNKSSPGCCRNYLESLSFPNPPDEPTWVRHHVKFPGGGCIKIGPDS